MHQTLPAASGQPATGRPVTGKPSTGQSLTGTPAAPDRQRFENDVLRGLSQHPKRLPPKYFYDQRGSELFDAICTVPEYYVTRTESAIMREHAAEIAACLPAAGVLLELGSGSSEKTRLLLDQLPELAAYVPVDISAQHLLATARRMQTRYRQLDVRPVIADFTHSIGLPPLPEAAAVSVYFPGSTIGNLEHPEAEKLLQRIARLMTKGGRLLIGVDLQKDPAIIEAAYNDRQGVTAEFNINLLQRINRELAGDFQLSNFVHEASYDPEAGRVEMRLRSTAAQTVRVAGVSFSIRRDEAIQTEYSHKYTIAGFAKLASSSGFTLRRQWLDDQHYFAVLLLENQND